MGRSRKGNPVHGWLAIDKEQGETSARVVARVRSLLEARKAGHAGTLDPLASGVLPVALGEATKTIPYAVEQEKTYRFTLRFGEARDTDDLEGQVTETSPVRPDDSALVAALPRFTGRILQTPPAYSAVKVGGRRAYALARAGQEVSLSPREVNVSRFDFVDRPDSDHATFEVVCSKGTYIRSLARDLSAAVNTCGHVTRLCRTAVGPFCRKDAISLDKLASLVHISPRQEYLLPVTTVLDDIPALALTENQADHLRHGRPVPRNRATLQGEAGAPSEGTVLCAMLGKTPVALVRIDGNEFRPLRVLNI